MKKYAIYIVGHYKNLNETWPQYKQIFKNTDEILFDFYFTLWNVKDVNDNSSITENDIYSLCPEAKKVNIIDSSIIPVDLPTKFEAKIGYQWYMIYSGFNIIPPIYDYYIRVRTDLYFFDTNIFEEIKNMDADLILSSRVWYIKMNYPYQKDAFNDYLWIGKYDISKYLADLYLQLDNYPVIYNEKAIVNHLLNYNKDITITHFKCDFNLDRRTRGAEMWLPESREMTARRNNLENKQSI